MTRMRTGRRGSQRQHLLIPCSTLTLPLYAACAYVRARRQPPRRRRRGCALRRRRRRARPRLRARRLRRPRENANPTLLSSGAVQRGAQRGAGAAPAAPAHSAGRRGAARAWALAERGRESSGAAAAPVSGSPGCTASPAPPPFYARADAMWPRVEAGGRHATARSGSKAERPTAGGPYPAAV